MGIIKSTRMRMMRHCNWVMKYLQGLMEQILYKKYNHDIQVSAVNLLKINLFEIQTCIIVSI